MEDNNPCQLEFPEVVVVEASAGTGKTYELAKRYLQLLINPHLQTAQINLRSILAITFTNKATIEMKERILEFLKKIALDAFSNKDIEQDILKKLAVDKKIAINKSHLIMDELMHHYNFFQVQTIDSFINALLLGSSLDIGRSGSFTIKRDYTQYLSWCLDNVIDEASVNKEILAFLEEFLEHYLFVENKNSWFPKKDILDLIKSLFTLSNKYGCIFEPSDKTGKDVLNKKKIIFREIQKLAKEIPPGINGNARNSILKFVRQSTSNFEFRKLPLSFKHDEAVMNKGIAASRQFSRHWEKLHKDIAGLAELEAEVAYIPYMKLFKKVFVFFQLISKNEDVIFLEELNHKARSLFDSGFSVVELYYRMATRLEHYLIDEFQDTSRLQWDNLKIMVEDALSSGGTLFYVGDKKQAIYGFRGGESRLFDSLISEFAPFGVKRRSLAKNWRSQKAIVEFNNEIFSQNNLIAALTKMKILPGERNAQSTQKEIINVYKDSHQQYCKDKTAGYVSIVRIDANDQNERNAVMKNKILDLIGELTKRFAPGDIAFLCRDNDEVELVTTWLIEAQFPVESEKTLNIKKNYLIKEIICFLKFLYYPLDEISFASFILGEIFCRATGLSPDDVRHFIFHLHKNGTSNYRLYRSFRRKYPLIWEKYFSEFLKSVGFISPYELIVTIYGQFKIVDNFSLEQGFFMKLLEVVKEQEEEYPGLGDLLLYLDNAPAEDFYVNVGREDALSVLTIHKSKGLEFGVVVIPFLTMDIRPSTGRQAADSYITELSSQVFSLLHITRQYREYSHRLKDIYENAYIKAVIGELNNIYVATSRAKFELYIFIPKRSARNSNKAWFLIPEQIKERGKKVIYKYRQALKQQSTHYLSTSCDTNWISFLREEFRPARILKNRNKTITGIIMHDVFSHIGNLRNKDIDEAIDRAIEYSQKKYTYFDGFFSLRDKISRFLKKKDIAPFFFVLEGKIYREKELIAPSGVIRRIDRLIIKKNEVWIIDYKTTDELEKEHQEQIKEYSGIVAGLYPSHRIKGFLLYLDKLSVKKIP